MANRIYIKRSNVAGKIPTSADIDLGEMALNTADVKLYASGTTANQILPIGWDRVARTGDTLTGDFNINGSITANTFVKSGGTSSQFLKADGSVDSTVYLSGETDTLQSVTTRGSATTTSILANAFIKSGGTNQQFLLADGSVTTASAITVTFTGTTNFIQKINASSALTNSLIYDNGTALGIDTTDVTDYTVTIGNQSDRSIGIESNLNGDGKSLTIAGGNGSLSSPTSGNSLNFTVIDSVSRAYVGVTVAQNGDVFATANSGDVYKQTGGIGAFVSLGGGQSSYIWRFMTTALNGDIYATVFGGDIFVLAGGTGTTFSPLSQTNRDYYGICTNTTNGDIYATVTNGDIYKQTGGIGNFVALGQTSRQWIGITEMNGDIYAIVFAGGLYKQTGGVGNFVAEIGITNRSYQGLTSVGNNLYATCDSCGDIFVRINNTGDFVNTNLVSRPYLGITEKDNNLYTVGFAFIAFSPATTLEDSNGGHLILQAGTGVGGATTAIDFNLPTVTSSGVTQTMTTQMSLQNNGDLTLIGRYIKAGGSPTQFLKADGSVDSSTYLTTETDTLQAVTSRGNTTTTNITANAFIKTGGLSTQFLKANGSVDSNTYLTSYTETDTLQSVTNRGATTTTNITANAFIKAGGTSNQFLMADGSVSLGGGGSVSFTGTTNFIQKLNATSALTNSLIHDNGIGLGIGTTAFTTTATTIQFGNQTNRKVTIEPILTGSGKSLVISAGDTNDTSGVVIPANSEFFTLYQNEVAGFRGWRQMTTAPNGDIYLANVQGQFADGDDLWKQVNGGTSFVPLGHNTFEMGGGVTVTSSGKVYIPTTSGIFTSIDGGTTYVPLGQTLNFLTMGYNSVSNDVYGAFQNGGIYKQTNATGLFGQLADPNRDYRGLLGYNGDMYILEANGDLYKQTGGVGLFVAQGLSPHSWWDLTQLNGHLYATDISGQIWVRRNNIGNWISTQNLSRAYLSISYSNQGDLYTAINVENIYKAPAGSANDNNFVSFTNAVPSVRGMGFGYNGDIYAVGCCGSGGWRLVNNTLPFVQIAGLSTGINWEGVAGGANGYIYAGTGTAIYKSIDDGATFNFVQPISCYGIYGMPNGDVYALGYNDAGGVFKSTDNGTSFVSLGQATRQWIGITALNNNVYACVNGGDIYMQTNATGNFNPLGQTNRSWFGMTSVNGDVYATVNNGDIYIQRDGVGNFVPLNQTTRGWYGMTRNINTNDIYASTLSADIYKSTNFNDVNAINNSAGGGLTLETGNGNGNSSNSIDFITSTPQTAGTGAQTKSTKMQILGNGYIKMTSIPTFADNASALAGGLTTGTLYKTSLGDLMIVI